MVGITDVHTTVGEIPRRLFFFNGGFIWQRRLRRTLHLAGHELCLGRPGRDDGVVVWGRSPRAWRGEQVAERLGLPVVRVEDAFLRSLRPGRMGDPPLGLIIDGLGVYFDSKTPSRLEHLLSAHPLNDAALLARANDGIDRLRALDLSKYNMHLPQETLPEPGYVLVVDQICGDASIAHAGASAASFDQMLMRAMADHPDTRIVVKSHPEDALALRRGHFTKPLPPGVTLLRTAVSPHRLLAGAVAVYTVSSQIGFEAILADHRPHVFGQPFYAGWGLTDDMVPLVRRKRSLTKAQLFAAAMILAPHWYDPCRDRLCCLEDTIDQLEAETRAFREDHAGHVALGMRLWKRGRLQAVFGREKPLIFETNADRALQRCKATGRNLLVWAGGAVSDINQPDLVVRRVEDGFLRSRGLGAALVPPLSLVADDLGIYYDPNRESRLERLLAAPPPPGGLQRAARLGSSLVAARISKYNLPGQLPTLPVGLRILVPGQVEDDASIRLGCNEVRTNLGLLRATRMANPDAVLVYKPHPDVEAGLRAGGIDSKDLQGLADVVADQADALALIDACDQVWTMTSLIGFEALLRGKPVTCLGAPFYAGWGLTRDLGPIPQRRLFSPDKLPLPQLTLDHLVHAALITYPRYYDPRSRLPCPPEVVVERLATGWVQPCSLHLRLLAKLQGQFATWSHLWR